MTTEDSSTHIDLSAHIAATYRTLRFVLVAVGFALPLVLWLGYYIFTRDLHLQNSMSAYYHAGNGVMRGWFVGSLFAIGALLFVYQGFTSPEDYALDVAGVLALGIALFPMPWPVGEKNNPFSLHGICAFLFFLCIAYVCIFQASATLKLIGNETRLKRYRWTYKALGIAMVASPVIAFILTLVPWFRSSLVFFIERLHVGNFAPRESKGCPTSFANYRSLPLPTRIHARKGPRLGTRNRTRVNSDSFDSLAPACFGLSA